MNGPPNAFTICAWPVVSAPGATCPPLLGLVDGRCAACNADGSENKLDILMVPVDEHLARRGEDVGSTALEEASRVQCEHSQKVRHGGERGNMVDLHQSFCLRPCENLRRRLGHRHRLV